MKDSTYFLHDFDAHTDPKIIKLRVKYGWEGYGLYRATLEAMRGEADVQLRQCDIDAFAFRLQCDTKKYADFLQVCVEVNLFIFDTKDKVYFSSRLQEDVEFMRNKSKKARASAKARWKARSNANALQTQSEGNAIEDIEDIEDIDTPPNPPKPTPPKKEFIPPTLEQVKSYFTEQGYIAAAGEKAWKYYESADWTDSKGNKVRSWKQKMQGVWFKDENKDKTKNWGLTEEQRLERLSALSTTTPGQKQK